MVKRTNVLKGHRENQQEVFDMDNKTMVEISGSVDRTVEPAKELNGSITKSVQNYSDFPSSKTESYETYSGRVSALSEALGNKDSVKG